MEDSLRERVMGMISLISPETFETFSQEQIIQCYEVALIFLEINRVEIEEDMMVKALCFKTLSLLYLQENSNYSKQRIKDVETAYYQGMGRSKWDVMYDAVVQGTYGNDLRYRGV